MRAVNKKIQNVPGNRVSQSIKKSVDETVEEQVTAEVTAKSEVGDVRQESRDEIKSIISPTPLKNRR